jgi:ribose-phosphate pyrophosphokinase
MPTLTPAPLLFAVSTARALGERVAAGLGIQLAALEERDFDGGEHKVRPLVNVRGQNVYVLNLLCGDQHASANDRLMRTLLFIGALKDAGAACVTACIPYLPYARKDRRTKSGDPVSTRYLAAMFEAVGTDRIVALDVHNLAAFENAFRIPTVPLDTSALFAAHLQTLAGADWVVASPDIGGVKRAQRMRELLAGQLKQPVGSAFMEKQRSSGVVSGETLVGDVKGKRVLIIDDLISSGTTMQRAAVACRKAGATQVHLAATHPVFAPVAKQLFATSNRDAAPDSVLVTNSVMLQPEFESLISERFIVLDIAPLLSNTIARLHAGESVDALCGL